MVSLAARMPEWRIEPALEFNREIARGQIIGDSTGLLKLIFHLETRKLLGVHIIGPEAFELIGEGVLAMESEATVDTLIHTIHAHPTIYEALGEAFEAEAEESLAVVAAQPLALEYRDAGGAGLLENIDGMVLVFLGNYQNDSRKFHFIFSI